MVSSIEVQGTQEFMGKQIPVVLGGFGENCKVMLAKTIAEIHGVEVKYINKLINNNIDRFKEKVDLIDLKTGSSKELVLDLGFTNAQYGNANSIYLLSERGYAKLIKIMDTDLAWEVHDELVSQYFAMKETINEMANMLTREEVMALKIFNANTKEEAMVAAGELDLYRKKQLATANRTIEEQRPLVEVAKQRRISDGLVTITDVTDTYGLKTGQLTCWAKINGYIHKSRKEVNEKGKEYFKTYGVEYPNVGVTESGMIFIDEHIEEIRKSPCRLKKEKDVA